MSSRLESLRHAFRMQYGRAPSFFVRAPGRVNLIGEHTDYNEGFVLPMAIDRDVRLALAPRADRQVCVFSLNFQQTDRFSLDNLQQTETTAWSNYLRGVAWALQQAGFTLTGFDAVIEGNVPLGSGLSSSAATELATVTAFRTVGNLAVGPVQAALLSQTAENDFVGVKCGIMDQYISSLGQAGHALLIDCRSLAYEAVPLPIGVQFIIVDSGVRRGLVDSAYNERREQCEEGARRLGVKALRDVDPAQFDRLAADLPPLVAQRCRHVVEENARVLHGVAALQRGDVATFGLDMDKSHVSLRDLYAVSHPALDILVEIARAAPGCLGSRLTGAGFGGCTVSLALAEHVPAIVDTIRDEYPRRTGLTPQIYLSGAESGAGILAAEA
jgi:galactokinase